MNERAYLFRARVKAGANQQRQTGPRTRTDPLAQRPTLLLMCLFLETSLSRTTHVLQRTRPPPPTLHKPSTEPLQAAASRTTLRPLPTQPWQTRTMAHSNSKRSSSSSSNRSDRSTANVRASAYVVNASSAALQGFHYSTTGAGGAEWCS